MLEIHQNALKVHEIYLKWYDFYKLKNYGAFVNFIGIVREEDGVEGLSFDLHEKMLKSWFELWEQKINKLNSILLMAHSKGDVSVHESSFMCAVISPKRRVGLEMLDQFVEDFKKNAPIWKYDLKNGKRIYAKERSLKLPHAGLLA